ncbi:outer membrane protein [Franzmannia pantelleriensis]|uniref:Outer membrane protein n=1 Tax=Franzmannia pantelleriensis TaxID=48727 RepID=A0A1G9GJG0_9GAMM|nr:TolC family outer membrane protein [Halomonas pantelleriensis]SDL00655.1 outer membrane protein [Halomonas pantelleriensis]
MSSNRSSLFPRRRWLVLLIGLAAAPAHATDLLSVARDALANDAGLASARAELQRVGAGRDVERGGLLPQLTAGSSLTHNRTYSTQGRGAQVGDPGGVGDGVVVDDEQDFNSLSLSLDASQALYDASRFAQLERAERLTDQQALSLEAAEQQLLFDVASAYFEILRAADILEARRAQETAISRQLEQAEERFEVGLTAITDVFEAQASFDLARAQRIAAENALQISFEALERLTDQRYASIDGLSDELPVEPPAPAERNAWVEMAMLNSPMLMMAEAGIEVARSDLDIARAGRLPSLEAFASYQYSDTDRSGVSGYNSDSQLGLRASVPLYTGGTTSAQIRQNTFGLEVSQYDFEAQRRDTVQQVRSLYTQVSNEVETVEARRQAIASNQSALDATRSGYEVGTRNIVDVLNAEQNLFNAIADYAEARYDYVLGLLELRQQSGTLDGEAIQGVNQWLDASQGVSLDLPDEAGGNDPAMNIGTRPTPPS